MARGRWLGVDWGERYIGVAATDAIGIMALPLDVVEGREEFFNFLDRYLAQESIRGIVVGLPRNMDGSEGPAARNAVKLADELRSRFQVEVVLWDERLTSVQAERLLKEAGYRQRRHRGHRGHHAQDDRVIDKVAAQILLQSYLDSRPLSSPTGDG